MTEFISSAASVHAPRRRGRLGRAARFALVLGCGFLFGCQASVESRLDEIKAMHEQGQVAEAIPMIEAVLDEHPDHPEANYLLGVSHISLNHRGLAVWSLRKAAESDDPVAPRAGLLLGNLLFKSMDLDEAVRVIDRVLEQEENRIAALLIRAQVYQEMKRHEDALADTRAVLDESPENYNALLMNTALLAELRRYDEAEEQMQALHELALRDVPSKAPNTCIAIASFHDEFRKDTEAARAQVMRCLEEFPDEQLVLDWAVAIHDRMGEAAVADQILEAATDRAPENLELWRLRAGRLLRAGDEPGGDALLVKVAELWDTPEGWNLLAEYRVNNGREEDAIEAFDRGLAAAGDEPNMAHQRAELLVTAKRYDEAMAAAEELGDGPQRDFVRARVLFLQGEAEEALELFEKGLATWPNNPGARYNAGVAAQSLGEWQRALDHYREASRAEAGVTDAALRMAEILLQQGEYVAANQLAVRHAQNRRGSGELYVLGALAALKAGMPGEARGIYEELVRDRAGMHIEALQGIALVERETDGPAAAIEVIESAEVDWSDPATRTLLRFALEDLGSLADHEKARRWVARVLAAQGEDAELIELRGRVQFRAGEKAAAARDFAEALALDADYGPAIMGQATLAALGGDRDTAIELFDRAADADTPDVEAAYMAAQLVLEKGDKAGAEARLREVVRTTPGNALACNDLAWLLAQDRRELEFATELASRATRIMPSALTYDTLGAVYLAASRETLAARALRKALEQDEHAAGSRYRLALALEQQGKPDEALGELRTAVAQGGFVEIDEARIRLAGLEQGQGAPR